MNSTEIILLDLEELLLQGFIKKNIDYQIVINNIKRDIKNDTPIWEDIKNLYIEIKKIYIFELPELKELLTPTDIKTLLDVAVEEEDYVNIFLALSLLEQDVLIEDDKIKIEEVLSTNKEYIYLFQDFYKKHKKQTTEFNQKQTMQK